MQFLGQEKTSLVDYPDKICTVYFVGGCNFKCPYCHNGPLVKMQGNPIKEEEVFQFLRKRKKYIDGVCISGGEPTLYEGLCDFIRKVRAQGLLVKLDTNGTNPQMLEQLLQEKLLDYIAMDIKAPLYLYADVAGVQVSIEDIRQSILLIQHAGIDYEFRTTVCKELLTKTDILEIASFIKGSRRYTLQNFRDGETVLGGAGRFHPFDINTLEEIERETKDYFEILKIRK
ncbi:anaerobic ribonucleoside-triphosphate reductase activating protein [Geosporobacter ferrireducens]|uniref:Anaerobic ribonucleoside-triphosphate reductase activating protein n=1 Tax=Geosporobacter ferrireducens TaxID=1424294 RepID=A0A1D8GJ91_9FIRM|nr:anaerobic ribonucleoside-triphosphate reductase activating protein [Geosporobacter ferrireducens]AOT70973.1 anaerobic ribonucleoside-triphosphate reductase activating protein [Geosporobacter ferrireducens]MTI53688.1 anaerobic ribonucleoside-triphosphate reductase activating protein [Geosporobacter ferrireducens]